MKNVLLTFLIFLFKVFMILGMCLLSMAFFAGICALLGWVTDLLLGDFLRSVFSKWNLTPPALWKIGALIGMIWGIPRIKFSNKNKEKFPEL